MKITTTQERLKAVLSKMMDVVPAKPSVPALACVRIAPMKDGDGIEVSGTDTNIYLRMTLECATEGEDEAIVPLRLLYGVVGNAAAGVMNIDSSEGRLRVKTATGRCSIATLGPEFFPPWNGEAPKEGMTARLPCARLSSMFDRVRFAIAPQSSTRTALKNAYIHSDGEGVKVVACNGRSLAMDVAAGAEAPCLKDGLLLPVSAMRTLDSVMWEGDVEIGVLGGERAVFSCKGAEMVTKLCAEGYPNYRQVIPAKMNHVTKVKPSDMATALQRTTPFAHAAQDLMFVKCEFKGSVVEISAETSDIGNAKESVPSSGEGMEDAIIFDPSLLASAISSAHCDEVSIEMRNAAQPVKITSDNGYLAVVMPIRIS